MNTAAPVIALRDAAFGYAGRSRVEDLTLDIDAGTAVALIGPNGSGKSTLLRGILGLAQLTAGSATVFGEDPVAARRHTGTLPQSDQRETGLPISLRQVVTMGLYRSLGPLRPLGRKGRAAIDGALDRVGLLPFAHHRFGELSGGQQQRGILARALVADPKLLLLDEPFTGLDMPTQDLLLELFSGLAAEGHAVVMSTHDLVGALHQCSRLCLVNRTVIADAPPAELRDAAVWMETFRLRADHPILGLLEAA